MSFDRLFKKRVPTPEQLHTLVKFVEHGSLSAAFGSGKSAQAAATQQLGRIDQCLGIRTRKSSGAYKVPTLEAQELASLAREFFQKLEDFKLQAERKPNRHSPIAHRNYQSQRPSRARPRHRHARESAHCARLREPSLGLALRPTARAHPERLWRPHRNARATRPA